MTLYYTLITSLPRHGRQFKVKETAISRVQLEKRLKLIPENERNILTQVENVIWNSWFSPELPSSETYSRAQKLFSLRNSFLNEIIHWHFNVRSLFVALRLRRRQPSPPPNQKNYPFGDLTIRLINNWHEPTFGLQHIYPWLPEVNKMIINNETAALEDILLTKLWKHLDVVECGHYFDFEAVIIYLLRWNIVNYWSRFNEIAAVECMNELADQAIRNYTSASETSTDKGSFA